MELIIIYSRINCRHHGCFCFVFILISLQYLSAPGLPILNWSTTAADHGIISARPAPAASCTLAARSGEVLQVLVPNKTEFKEFVDCSDVSNVRGFCVDVFNSALSILVPRPCWTRVNYTCYRIGSQSYDTMINLLADADDQDMKDDQGNLFDAAVGDITVSAARLLNASFTQTYLDSGIVIVAPDGDVSQSLFRLIFAPFTRGAWAFMVGSVVLTGLALGRLEHVMNVEDRSLQQAAPAYSRVQKVKRIIWPVVTSVLLLFKKDSIKNPLAKFVRIAWIVFMLLVGSSYTASLSSILTVTELSQKSWTLKDLRKMNKTVGYQVGSVVKDYLERHNITNLKPLNNTAQYADELRSKGVVAVVDEIHYISLFLAAQSASDCKFSVSQKLTIEGLGFAFHDRTLSAAFSVAILNLSESGQMRTIQDGWKLSNFQCPSRIQSTQLNIGNSAGLFLFLGGTMVFCFVIFLLKHKIGPYLLRIYERSNQPARDAANIDAGDGGQMPI